MPRLVIHTATGPSEVKTKSGDSVWICRCGLTDNEDGTCSSNHKKFKVADEDPKRYMNTMMMVSGIKLPKNVVVRIAVKMRMKNVAQTVVVKMTTMKKRMTRKNLVVVGIAVVVVVMKID